jgi:acyl dehydratase
MTGAADKRAARSLPDPGVKIPSRDYGPFEREGLAHYASVSGDSNPIHRDVEAAKSAGLSDTPVHGMLMLSCFEPFVNEWRQDLFIARLSCKFISPVFAGESIRISGRAVSRRGSPRPESVLRLTAHRPDNSLVIVGEATVLRKPLGRPR